MTCSKCDDTGFYVQEGGPDDGVTYCCSCPVGDEKEQAEYTTRDTWNMAASINIKPDSRIAKIECALRSVGWLTVDAPCSGGCKTELVSFSVILPRGHIGIVVNEVGSPSCEIRMDLTMWPSDGECERSCFVVVMKMWDRGETPATLSQMLQSLVDKFESIPPPATLAPVKDIR